MNSGSEGLTKAMSNVVEADDGRLPQNESSLPKPKEACFHKVTGSLEVSCLRSIWAEVRPVSKLFDQNPTSPKNISKASSQASTARDSDWSNSPVANRKLAGVI